MLDSSRSMQAHSVLAHAQPRRMTRSEYDRLVAQGMFAEERVELIRGIVVEMAPVAGKRLVTHGRHVADGCRAAAAHAPAAGVGHARASNVA